MVNVRLDLHESPSWESMDSLGRTVYDKRHQLEYRWVEEQQKFLVPSPHNNKIYYNIETVYDMTDYLEKEFGLKWL
jgi:hypothetical protein